MDYHIVHIRINDAATGQPTPVRLRLGQDSRYFPPLGRPDVIPVAWGESVGGSLRLGGRAYAYVDGACEARLPAGPLQVEIMKGPEYAWQVERVELLPGQLALRFNTERQIDWTKDGWYSGDTHAQFLTPTAAALEGGAEGLHIVNMLASEAYLPDLLEFSGQEPAHTAQGCSVAVNTLNEGGDLGRLALLSCHRVVFPLTLEAIGFERYTLADWCGQCHRKGGLVVWPHFPNQPGEAIADLLLGEIDAVEWTGAEPFGSTGLPEWYRLLNLGFRIPLVGGSGKGSNAVPLGAVRTYAQLQAPGHAHQQANEEAPRLTGSRGTAKELIARWIEAIRAGRTFVTRSPLLRLTVNGKGPGSSLDAGGGELTVEAEAVSVTPFERMELVRDGEVLGTSPCDSSGRATLSDTIANGAAGWLAVRCWSADGLSAHSSPIYLSGSKRSRDSALATPLLQRLDWLQAFAEDFAADAEQQKHLLEIATKARTTLEQHRS
jgi:hypothetical protein